VNTTHIEPHIQTLEDEVTDFRDQLLKSNSRMDASELRQQLGAFTAKRKAELGFYQVDT
jgi:hypothetical protein